LRPDAVRNLCAICRPIAARAALVFTTAGKARDG